MDRASAETSIDAAAASERSVQQVPSAPVIDAEALAGSSAKSVPIRVADGANAALFTFERTLYALLLLVAAYWRAWGLGMQPLSAWEASNSLPAWLTAHGLGANMGVSPNSSLYYGLQWLVFWLGLDGDLAARLLAAAAGVGMVFAAWWWRDWLGRSAALVLAALLAINPWASALSRMADGASLSLLFCFAALTALVNIAASPFGVSARTWTRIGAVATGLMMVSGPLGLNLLPVVVLGVFLWRADLLEASLLGARLWAWLAGSAVLGGSLFLVRLDGLAWFASSMSVWLGQFGGDLAANDLTWLVARLLVEGVLPLLLGMVGLVGVWRTDPRVYPVARRWAILMSGWLAWGLLLCLLPGRSTFGLGVLILPLVLLAAPVIVQVWGMRPRDIPRQELGAVVLTLLVLLISASFWAAALGANPIFDPVIAQATAVILALSLAILLAFGVWSRRQNAGWIASMLVIGLLVVAHARAGWLLGQASISAPSGWTTRNAHPEGTQLTEDIETLSAQTVGDPYQLPIHVEMASYPGFSGEAIPAHRDPILGWALRHMDVVTWGNLPEPNQLTGVVITVPRLDQSAPPLPSSYAGSAYDVEWYWTPSDLVAPSESTAADGDAGWWQSSVRPWWRWAVYRKVESPPPTRAVVLWAPQSGVQSDE